MPCIETMLVLHDIYLFETVMSKKNNSQDLEFETAMHLEREQRVKQLESDIIDINEIMRDLSSMVTAQGDVVGKSKPLHNKIYCVVTFFGLIFQCRAVFYLV